jgi:hypothetical protein
MNWGFNRSPLAALGMFHAINYFNRNFYTDHWGALLFSVIWLQITLENEAQYCLIILPPDTLRVRRLSHSPTFLIFRERVFFFFETLAPLLC